MIYKNGNIKEIYHGSVKVKELYKGSELVYRSDNDLILIDGANYGGMELGRLGGSAYMEYYDLREGSDHTIVEVKSSGSINNATVSLVSKLPILLSGYSKLYIDFSVNSGNNNIVRYGYNASNNIVSIPGGQYGGFSGVSGRSIKELNIDSVTGSYYIQFELRTSHGSLRTALIYKLGLEK